MNKMKKLTQIVFSFTLLLFGAACSSEKPARSEPALTSAPANVASESALKIDWFDGSVAEALAQAKDQNRPVFMYWGAVWCPPCNLIKSTVFTDPEFIQQTRDYVAVYLDGDQDDAQRWGEHFSAMGYPTLIVLSPQGEEITRLSSGQHAEAYRTVLQQARASRHGIAELLEQALTTPEQLNEDSWRVLAQHGWDLDQGKLLGDRPAIEVFEALAERCPQESTQARFRVLATLQALADKQPLTPESAALMQTVLASQELLRSNLSELQYNGGKLLLALDQVDEKTKTALLEQYEHRMNQVWQDEDLPLKLRFNAHHGLLDLALAGVIDKPKFSKTFRQRVDWLSQQDLNPQQAQSMIPGAAWMLHRLDQSEAALTMLKRYMTTAITPYYSMSYLAAIEEDLNNKDAALAWSNKAWQSSEGPATRIQWGLSHLNRLLRLAPEQQADILGVLSAVFEQLKLYPGSFYQRTSVRLKRTLEPLQQWAGQADNAVRLQSISDIVDDVCGGLEQGHPSADLCQGYQELVAAKTT